MVDFRFCFTIFNNSVIQSFSYSVILKTKQPPKTGGSLLIMSLKDNYDFTVVAAGAVVLGSW